MHVTYKTHVAHSVHVACRYWPGNMLHACCQKCNMHVTCSYLVTTTTAKKNWFCSSLSQTCVGSCDSLSQPCTKIPVCDKVLPDCHNLETRLLIACFLYTSLLQPCHMLVQPCHFCMGRAFLQPAATAAMHCHPPGDIHPPPLIPPFLLAPNLSSKRIAPTDNMQPNFDDNYSHHW